LAGGAVLGDDNGRLIVRMRRTGWADPGRHNPAGDVIRDRHYAGMPADHVVDDATVSVAHLLLEEAARADTGGHGTARGRQDRPPLLLSGAAKCRLVSQTVTLTR
jgi:hypothetical protein